MTSVDVWFRFIKPIKIWIHSTTGQGCVGFKQTVDEFLSGDGDVFGTVFEGHRESVYREGLSLVNELVLQVRMILHKGV